MRRSTAAAFGTLTGAALIVGVRLSVSAPEAPVAAPPAVDLSGNDTGASAKPAPSKKKVVKPKPRITPKVKKAPPPAIEPRVGGFSVAI